MYNNNISKTGVFTIMFLKKIAESVVDRWYKYVVHKLKKYEECNCPLSCSEICLDVNINFVCATGGIFSKFQYKSFQKTHISEVSNYNLLQILADYLVCFFGVFILSIMEIIFCIILIRWH